MTIKVSFFIRNAAGGHDPVVLAVTSVKRDGRGAGTIDAVLSSGEKVTLHAEYDPGKVAAGETFYATIEPGNRSTLIPWRQARADPTFAALAQEGGADLRAQVQGRIDQWRELLGKLKAAPVPSPQLLATAKNTVQLLCPAPGTAAVATIPARRVNFAQASKKKHKSRPWKAELRVPGNLDAAPFILDAFRDTGAEINCIEDAAARRLKLPEIGLVDISGITSTPQRMPRVKVHVTLPKYGIAREDEAAVIPDLVARCGREFLIGDELSDAAEEAMGVM